MKRFLYIIAVCAVLGACAKTPRQPLVYGTGAPILLETEGVSVKGGVVESLSGLAFRVYARDPEADDSMLMDGVNAVADGNSLRFRSQSNEADSICHYPQGKDFHYRFYAIHGKEEAGMMPVGHQDILWGQSSDSVPLQDLEDPSVVWYGYNYDYAVRAALWYPEESVYHPHIRLQHSLSRISIAFVAESSEAQALFAGKVFLEDVTLGGVHRMARLNVWDGSFSDAAQSDTLIVQGTPVEATPEGNILGTVFVLPGECPDQYNYTLRLVSGESVSDWTSAVSMPFPEVTLQRGHHYLFKITIKEIDDIEAFLEDNYIDAGAATFQGLEFDWEDMGDEGDNQAFEGDIYYD